MKTVGVLGGMGPQATLYFCQQILDCTDADRDQEHVPLLIDSNTAVPDRTAAIQSGDRRAVERMLITSVQRLEAAGAAFVVVPCNTAHVWLDAMQVAVSIDVLDMPETCAQALQEEHPGGCFGLLSTNGTRQTGLYQRAFDRLGCDLLTVDGSRQAEIDRLIAAIKAGRRGEQERRTLRRAVADLRASGARKVVLGCTELPLVADRQNQAVADPMAVLARVVVQRAGGRLKAEG